MTAKIDNGNELSQCENGHADKHKKKAKEKRDSHQSRHENGKSHHDHMNGNANAGHRPSKHCHRHHSRSSKAESVLSTLSSDSDIRFTRKKLGDNQKCGCALIAGFLVVLLLAATLFYIGYSYLHPGPLPNRTFQGRFTVIEGERWTSSFADQNSLSFKTSSRDYRERLNLVIRKSDLRDPYEGCEILALDGKEENDDLTILFALYFEPYAALVSAAELHAILMEEIINPVPRYFANITIDPNSLEIKEISARHFDDIMGTSSSPLGRSNSDHAATNNFHSMPVIPQWKCEAMTLPYCRSMGYNITTYPNYLGHANIDAVKEDLISFRDLVDAECYRQAYDFVCRVLQPPCIERVPLEPYPAPICRQYCQDFWAGCGERIPQRLKKLLDCEKFPESKGAQSCQNAPGCVTDLQSKALSSRLCDGIADCPDFTDETTCAFCPSGSMYCGKGRRCIAREQRCDGNIDCENGSDEKDCLSITPLVSYLEKPLPITPQRAQFDSEGFAVFTEKGVAGKICAEGMERGSFVRKTVAESLCKALGYEKVSFSKITNDTEPNGNYVRVLDPKAHEISFVRTPCNSRQVLYVSCENLECGMQSGIGIGETPTTLPKMASPGDWPWYVALFRADTHVCDGSLVSEDWVLTTDSCFQGQSKAIWMAVLGNVRLSSTSPWTQRRRIVGMIKSPVEGSTAALIRLETPVTFSDFVRPICLPDSAVATNGIRRMDTFVNEEDYIDDAHDDNFVPQALKFEATPLSFVSGLRRLSERKRLNENTQYFVSPEEEEDAIASESEDYDTHYEKYQSDEENLMPKAEAVVVSNETINEVENKTSVTPNTEAMTMIREMISWTQCNTIGWSRQRDHLQRVQLKIGDMGACENISIATVNSLCTEALYHKQDCSEEEFAGSSIMCLLPDNKRWAIVGVAPWRIACAPNGIERPRMYDKISSNAAWIRSVITAE
ncbi:uncharacterized protein LOC134834199 [Culicoides brevitarsis]|uniref:uncharacterized protein LOC134834199 n=1 Tax=Culicoides brevitarsis TaxID=469753 RepID=UPI00307BD6FD